MYDFKAKVPLREECVYTSCFCEENIWHLCRFLTRGTSKFKCYCVFVSNPSKAVHLWKQKYCNADEQPVIWDYHVFAVYGNNEYGYCVLDLDTTLPFPVSFQEYVEKAIRCESGIFKRYFRVITAEEYLREFSSDRRHMQIGSTWLKPPPEYPPIISHKDNPHNLSDFISMEKGTGYGEVLDQKDFIKRFGVAGKVS